MYPRYFALRRVNPYRGVVQHVEAGESVATSHDGLTWHIRADDGYGWVRPAGVWEEGVGLRMGQARDLGDILAALETRPALPFPMFDVHELWLLDRDSGLPLALLATDRGMTPGSAETEVDWLPFVTAHTGFSSAALASHGVSPSGAAHKDFLARFVNQAARPNPMTQWFKRGQDGIGHGEPGRRLPYEWRGRQVASVDFPQLLVREHWNNPLEQSVIADYHHRLAPLLLLWPRLSPETRLRLEGQACENPRWLARVHRLLPVRMMPERIQAALVAARLEEALEPGADDLT